MADPLRANRVRDVVDQQTSQSRGGGGLNKGNLNLGHLDPLLREGNLGHLRQKSIGRVEVLVDGLVCDVAAREVGGESDTALRRHTSGALNGVGDAGNVERLEVDGLVGRCWNESRRAVQKVVGDAVGGDLVARLRNDASYVDARDTLDEYVEGVVLQALVGADRVDLRDGGNAGEVVEGGELLHALALAA